MLKSEERSEDDELGGAERVFAFFRQQLLSGALKAGDRLLGERELALKLGIGRPLLREAMRSLAMLGLLDIRHGKGAYVAKADIGVLTDFFTFCLAQEQDILDDVFQARVAIECQAIRLACVRANESDIARLGERLNAVMESLGDPERGGQADFRFHQALVEASHSKALVTLYAAISELLLKSHVERRRVTFRAKAVIDDLVEAHRQVFLAVIERDPDAADRCLREHFAIGDELRRKSLIATYGAIHRSG